MIRFLDSFDKEIIQSFLSMLEPYTALWKDHQTLYLTEVIGEEPLDFLQVHDWITSELLLDTVIVLFHEESVLIESHIHQLMTSITPGVYTLSDLIIEAQTKQFDDWLKELKERFKLTLGEELIRSMTTLLECELNQSVAAKKLYLHRNTLLYRIDQFKKITTIDINKFGGAFAFGLLNLH